MKIRRLFVLAFWLACGQTAAAAAADISARYEFEGGPASLNMAMTLEIDANGNERVQMSNQASYMLVLGDVTYLVSRGPTGIYVARMDDVVTVLGEKSKSMGLDKAFAAAPENPAEKPPVMASMGPKVVNGRTGTAYGISENGKRPVYALIVISDDPKLAPLGVAFAKSFSQSSTLANKMIPGLGSIATYFGEDAALLKKGAPLSLVSMNLSEVSFAHVDDNRFVLPSQPLSIGQIRQQFESFPEPPTLPARAH